VRDRWADSPRTKCLNVKTNWGGKRIKAQDIDQVTDRHSGQSFLVEKKNRGHSGENNHVLFEFRHWGGGQQIQQGSKEWGQATIKPAAGKKLNLVRDRAEIIGRLAIKEKLRGERLIGRDAKVMSNSTIFLEKPRKERLIHSLESKQ